MIPITSSNIRDVNYDEEKRVLTINFISGGCYKYQNFSIDMFNKFLSAESPGSFFAKNIKDKYPCKKQEKKT